MHETLLGDVLGIITIGPTPALTSTFAQSHVRELCNETLLKKLS